MSQHVFTTNDMTVNKFEPDISEEKRETGRETGFTTFGGGMMGGGRDKRLGTTDN